MYLLFQCSKNLMQVCLRKPMLFGPFSCKDLRQKWKNWVTTSSTISWKLTLIWLLCSFRRIKASPQTHSGVVVWVCCRSHPEMLLCLFSVCGLGGGGGAERRCRIGTSPFLPGISWLSDLPTPSFHRKTALILSRCRNTWQYNHFSTFLYVIFGVTAWLLLCIFFHSGWGAKYSFYCQEIFQASTKDPLTLQHHQQHGLQFHLLTWFCFLPELKIKYRISHRVNGFIFF